jgi:hypothetical protein
MGASFSKLQGVLRHALQILPADNIKGLKTQPSLTSAAREFQEFP